MTSDNIPETLWGLLNHYSPTGDESEAVNYLIKRMGALGFTKSWQDEIGNAVGVMGEGSKKILLLGHIDTVPGNIDVHKVDNILFGRGSVDAKGPLAAFVDAVAQVGEKEDCQFIVIGAVEEEGDSKGAQYVADNYQADMVIIGEPSRWDRITLGYKGSVWTEFCIKRQKFHTAGQGMSAPEAVFELWERINKKAAEHNQDRESTFRQIQPTLRYISSGEDDFDEWATIRVGTRLPEDLAPEDWLAVLETLKEDAELKLVGFPLAAHRASKNNDLVRSFLKAIRSADGKPGFVLKTGTADFNIIGPSWKCPILAYGPGDSSLDHTPQEHLSLPEYEKAVKVLSFALDLL